MALVVLLGAVALVGVTPAVASRTSPSTSAASESSELGNLVAVRSTRAVDTRYGIGGFIYPVTPERPISVSFAVVAPVVGAISAVRVTVTSVNAQAAGYVTAYPTGGSKPLASCLNYVPGRATSNTVIVPTDRYGKATFFASAATDVVIDLTGYVVSDAQRSVPTSDGSVVPVAPSRVLDTRIGVGAVRGPVAAGQTRAVPIAGRGGVPATGVSAVLINLTATDVPAPAYVTAYPSDRPRPTASVLNVSRGGTVANLVTVPVASDGSIALYASGQLDLVGDVAGYVVGAPHGTSSQVGATVTTVPTRVLDTRAGGGRPVQGGSAQGVQVTGRGGVPATNVSAALLVVTETGPAAAGYLTVYPTGADRPNVSVLNVLRGETRAVEVLAPLSVTGSASIFTSTATHLVVDVGGYVVGTPGVVAPAPLPDLHANEVAAGSADIAWTLPADPAVAATVVSFSSPTTAVSGMCTVAAPDTSCRTATLTGGTYTASGATRNRYGTTSTPRTATFSITPNGPARVHGTVTDGSGHPVSGATVVVAVASNGVVAARPTTDRTGHYDTGGIAPGDYTVCAKAPPAAFGDIGLRPTCWRTAPRGSTSPDRLSLGAEQDAAADVSMAPGGAVTGTVKDSDGAAAVGASVEYGAVDPSDVVTDGQGRYWIGNLPNGSSEVCATHPSLERGCWRGDGTGGEPAPVEEGRTTSGIDVVLAKEGAIAGTVRDASGAPVVGARVSLTDHVGVVTVTDAKGAYSFGQLTAGTYHLCFNADPQPSGTGRYGFVRTCPSDVDGAAVTVAPGRTVTYAVVLQSAGSVSGRVTDTKGRPRSGVYVYVRASGEDVEYSYTGADGRYLVTGVPPGAESVCFQSGCTGDGTRAPVPDARPDGAVTGVDDVEPGPATVRGRVVSAEGAGIPGIDVTLQDDTSGSVGYATTGADGRWSATVARPATPRPCFAEDRGRTLDDSGWIAQCGSTTFAVDYDDDDVLPDQVLQPAGTVSGRATDTRGDPLPGVGVWINQNGDVRPTARTGADGRYVLTDVQPGSGQICFRPDGGGAFPRDGYVAGCYRDDGAPATADRSDVVRIGAGEHVEGVDASFIGRGRISGTVRSSADGSAVGFAIIETSNVPRSSVTADGAGSYVLPQLDPGTYVVCADGPVTEGRSAGGNCPDGKGSRTVTVHEGEEVAGTELDLDPGALLIGQVTDSEHGPLSNVVVTVNGTDPSSPRTTTTDSAGRFAVPVPPGTYTVCFRPSAQSGPAELQYAPGCFKGADPQGHPTPVTVASNDTADLSDSLPEAGGLAGTVSNAQGQGVSGFVSAQSVATDRYGFVLYEGQSRVAADGTYEIVGLPTGTYHVSYSGDQGTCGYGNVGHGDVQVTDGILTSPVDFGCSSS